MELINMSKYRKWNIALVSCFNCSRTFDAIDVENNFNSVYGIDNLLPTSNSIDFQEPHFYFTFWNKAHNHLVYNNEEFCRSQLFVLVRISVELLSVQSMKLYSVLDWMPLDLVPWISLVIGETKIPLQIYFTLSIYLLNFNQWIEKVKFQSQ